MGYIFIHSMSGLSSGDFASHNEPQPSNMNLAESLTCFNFNYSVEPHSFSTILIEMHSCFKPRTHS